LKRGRSHVQPGNFAQSLCRNMNHQQALSPRPWNIIQPEFLPGLIRLMKSKRSQWKAWTFSGLACCTPYILIKIQALGGYIGYYHQINNLLIIQGIIVSFYFLKPTPFKSRSRYRTSMYQELLNYFSCKADYFLCYTSFLRELTIKFKEDWI
jgi:hypothetical protein